METREISIKANPAITPSDAAVEIVERKGLGHPDTICDAVMEHVSQALCAAYLERFGRILHYNCDKGSLLAGQTEPRFGGGRVIEPMRLIIGDRATTAFGKERLDVGAVAMRSAAEWFRANLPRIDPLRDVRIEPAMKPGSAELVRLFEDLERAPRANDTSAAVGYAPLTETEHLVLEAEAFLNSPGFKSRLPAAGEDVKIMGVRRGRTLELTVAVPLVDRFIRSDADYVACKEDIRVTLRERLRSRLEQLADVDVRLNALDEPGAGIQGMYLTVLGTSAEHGDSGAVGRGNDVTGFWSLNRPQSGEAAAGKNPTRHVGKIYSVFAHQTAGLLYRNVPGVRAATVRLVSTIGRPVTVPSTVAVEVDLAPGAVLPDVSDPIRGAVESQILLIPELCEGLIQGRHRLF